MLAVTANVVTLRFDSYIDLQMGAAGVCGLRLVCFLRLVLIMFEFHQASLAESLGSAITLFLGDF